jgi:hypothetical protein
MRTQNIKTIFLILKELVVLIKLILDEWDKEEEEENGKAKN